MLAENRQWERVNDRIRTIKATIWSGPRLGFHSPHEEHGSHLEGTVVMVVDYVNNIAYANRSPRTHEVVLREAWSSVAIETTQYSMPEE